MEKHRSNWEINLSILFGSLRVVIGVTWLILGLLGLRYGLRHIQNLGGTLDQSIRDIMINIDVVTDLLTETIDVFDMVDQSLSTVERNMIDASIAMSGSRPIIEQTSKIVVQDVPNALDDVQASMPSVIEAATAIDQSLRLLSKLQLSIPIPFGPDFEVGLGIDYDPPVPLDEALTRLSGNLEGIPKDMRAIEGDMVSAENNLTIVGNNLMDMARDIDFIREQLEDINPEINRLITNMDSIQSSLQQTQNQVPKWMKFATKALIGFVIVFSMSQITTVYFGYLSAREGYIQQNEARKGRKEL